MPVVDVSSLCFAPLANRLANAGLINNLRIACAHRSTVDLQLNRLICVNRFLSRSSFYIRRGDTRQSPGSESFPQNTMLKCCDGTSVAQNCTQENYCLVWWKKAFRSDIRATVCPYFQKCVRFCREQLVDCFENIQKMTGWSRFTCETRSQSTNRTE